MRNWFARYGQRLALYALDVVMLAPLLWVSFAATREIGLLFQASATLAILFALGIDTGVIGASVASGLRTRDNQDARMYQYLLIGTLAISFVASALAGARTFGPAQAGAFFDSIGFVQDVTTRNYARVLLVGLFAAAVPPLTYGGSALLSMLVSEDTHAQVQETRDDEQGGTRTMRIVQYYQEQIERGQTARALPVPDIARQFQVSAATVRKARQVVEGSVKR
ncbi:MAG: hypothetical protein ABIH03_01660 [Pseudomonadota bacterium]